MFLDPAKLLVILIVALVVLGPDKLPVVARQMGAAWGELRKFRAKLETEVRGSFPDLPSTQQVAQAVRSPLAFLDQLADAHERDQQQQQTEEPASPASITPTAPAPASEAGNPAVDAATNTADGPAQKSALSEANGSGHNGATGHNGAPSSGNGQKTSPAVPEPAPVAPNGTPRPAPRTGPVGRTRPFKGPRQAESAMMPDDPSMN